MAAFRFTNGRIAERWAMRSRHWLACIPTGQTAYAPGLMLVALPTVHRSSGSRRTRPAQSPDQSSLPAALRDLLRATVRSRYRLHRRPVRRHQLELERPRSLVARPPHDNSLTWTGRSARWREYWPRTAASAWSTCSRTRRPGGGPGCGKAAAMKDPPHRRSGPSEPNIS